MDEIPLNTTMKFGVGASVRRKEDVAFITGKGRYTDDINPPGTLRAIVLRSPMAHARFRIRDIEAARRHPGVYLVLTAADIADLGPLPCKALLKQADGTIFDVPEHPVLARDTVRHVGDPIAFIVAEDEATARNAAELIDIEWEALPAVADTMAALAPDAPKVWPGRPDNVAFTYALGDAEKTEAAFAKAARTVELRVVNNRIIANYMEPRGVIAEYDAGSGRWTLTMGTQGGHGMRDIIAGSILKVDPSRIRVITPDVGGGFGTKGFVYAEYPLAAVAAQRLGRPVKWIADRSDHFVIDAHGRDNVTTATLAFDADNRILGMKVDLVADMGAYLHQYGPFIPYVGVTMSTGVYDIPTLSVRVRGVYTNRVPVDAYRGAGRPEAAYLLERLMDYAAGELGVSPAELRRKNFIRPEQMPYRTQTGRLYDTGEFDGQMTKALEVADAAGFPARREASRAAGKFRGFGFATYIEACAFPGNEPATLSLEQDGTIQLLIGTQTNGQGHATAYAQVAAAHLGVDIDRINVIQGDTDLVKQGGGTGGSRSIPIGAVSVDRGAAALAEKIRKLAADALEAGTADIELVDGSARVVGTDRVVTYADLASRAASAEERTATGDWQQGEPTYPNGTHVCEVEIDPETGMVEIVRYTVVDDFGTTVNPMLLAGQIHGGIMQGIGQALVENAVYDESGQLITASFMDYSMPRADLAPFFHFETRNVPAKSNALGIKGAGEAGTIGAAPAVMNAVVDALRSGCGIRHIDMPATPRRVWEAIQAAA